MPVENVNMYNQIVYENSQPRNPELEKKEEHVEETKNTEEQEENNEEENSEDDDEDYTDEEDDEEEEKKEGEQKDYTIRNNKGGRRRRRKGKTSGLLPQELLNMNVRSPEALHEYVTNFYNTLGVEKTGSYVSLNHVNYKVNVGTDGERTILKDVSFYLKPGMMCLLLGNPGGGRSSLLKILANTISDNVTLEGEVLYNNHKIDPLTHHRNVSYITQSDNHMPLLTVRETLEFSSNCILPTELSDDVANQKRLDILLYVLGLEKAQNTLVGNDFIRGVSGGEKKRVTVGVDMMKGADLLLMDEPSTGLDSVTTYDLMRCVRALTNSGKLASVVALLQPPKEAFELFDTVMLLDDGEIAYFGPREDAVKYFQDLGFNYSEKINPAEFLQEVVNFPKEFVDKGSQPPVVTPAEFAEAFKETSMYEDISETVANPRENLIPEDVTPKDATGKDTYLISPWRQYTLCLWRAFLMTKRNTTALLSRSTKVVILGIILGTLFLNIKDDQNGAAQRRGLLFFVMLQILFASLITIRDLYDQRPIVHEQRNVRKWYTTLPYFAAYLTPEIIIGFVEVVVFSVTIYWLIDLQFNSGRFFFFVLMLYAVELIGASIIAAVAAATPSSLHAGTLVPAIDLLLVLTSGFLIPGNQIPGWWVWLYWASPIRWAFEGLLLNEYTGLVFSCDNPLGCQFQTGDQILSSAGYFTEFWFRWVDLAIVYGYVIFLLAFAYFCLKFFNPSAGPARPKKKKSKMNAIRQTGSHQKAKAATGQQSMNDLTTADDEEVEYEDEKVNQIAIDMAPESNSLLKVTGAYLTFSHINYFVAGEQKQEESKQMARNTRYNENLQNAKEAARGNEKQILHDVSGLVQPGVLLALMGASGAGKSTLLDILADRKKKGGSSRITGEVLVNGKKRDSTFTRYSAYVTQNDVLFPTHTVKEAITFSAQCRLDEAIPADEKAAFVEKILIDLDLKKIENKMVGMGDFGLSPEQRKRLNLAVELASNPQLIFLDEPTTGLDSSEARRVMNVVKKLSQQGRSIICTIHQPSSEIFQLFDSLLLMSKNGKPVYFGPIGKDGDKFMRYCCKQGYSMEEGRNRADFALEFSNAYQRGVINKEKANPNCMTMAEIEDSGRKCRKEHSDDEVDQQGQRIRRRRVKTIEGLVDKFDNSKLKKDSEAQLNDPNLIPQNFNPPQYNSKYATSFATQFRINLQRAMLSLWVRRKKALYFQLIRMLVFGVFMGTIFISFNQNQSGITNRVAWIFFTCIFGGFIGFAFIPMIAQERGVFYHEQSSGAYRPTSYALATILTFLPMLAITSILYIFPAYWIPNFDPRHSFSRFLFIMLVQFLAAIVLVGLSHVLAVACPSEGIAVMCLGVIAPVMLLFAGFFIPRTQIRGWSIEFYWISFLHYAVEAASLETFSGLTFHCTGSQYLRIDGVMTDNCPLTTFQEIIQRYGLFAHLKWIDVAILFGIYGVIVVAICFSLAKIRHVKT